MLKTRKTWREKLERDQEPKVVDDRRGRGKVLIPKPLDVDALVRRIDKGKLATDKQIREQLAKDFHADFACPMTTGIFIRIAAETAEVDLGNRKGQVAPYWRVIKADGSLNQRFPCGTEAQATHLRQEGHSIKPSKGKKPPRVKDFEKSLHKL